MDFKYKLLMIFSMLVMISGFTYASNLQTSDGSAITVGSNLDLGGNNITDGRIINLTYGYNQGGFSQVASDRPLTTEEHRNITVCLSGCDYATIQEAVDTVPLIMRHDWDIQIKDGTYNEDVVIPPVIISKGELTEGATGGLGIGGNRSNINGVKIKSIKVLSGVGANVFWFRDFQLTGTEPTSDEDAGFSIYGTRNALLYRINFTTPASKAILAYSSDLTVHSSSFNAQQYAVYSKASGNVRFGDDYQNSQNNGSVTGYLLKAGIGISVISSNNSVTYGSGYVADCANSYESIVIYNQSIICPNKRKNLLFDADKDETDELITIQTSELSTSYPQFVLSHRSDNKNLRWYSYDGSTFVNFFSLDYNQQETDFLNNLDMTSNDIQNVGEIEIDGVSSDGSGKAVCVKADGNLGTCSDAVGVGGTCSCS